MVIRRLPSSQAISACARHFLPNRASARPPSRLARNACTAPPGVARPLQCPNTCIELYTSENHKTLFVSETSLGTEGEEVAAPMRPFSYAAVREEVAAGAYVMAASMRESVRQPRGGVGGAGGRAR